MLYFNNIAAIDISHAVRLLRKKKGWTQQQLADFSNTSKSNISNLENGNQGYSPAMLQYLAQAFGCSVSQIFLLAEQLEKQDEAIEKVNWQDMPIELLFMQLPESLQQKFRQVLAEIVQHHQ